MPDNAQALLELRTGRAVAVLSDYPPAAELANGARTRAYFQLAADTQYEPGLYGAAVAKDRPRLRDAVHGALERAHGLRRVRAHPAPRGRSSRARCASRRSTRRPSPVSRSQAARASQATSSSTIPCATSSGGTWRVKTVAAPAWSSGGPGRRRRPAPPRSVSGQKRRTSRTTCSPGTIASVSSTTHEVRLLGDGDADGVRAVVEPAPRRASRGPAARARPCRRTTRCGGRARPAARACPAAGCRSPAAARARGRTTASCSRRSTSSERVTSMRISRLRATAAAACLRHAAGVVEAGDGPQLLRRRGRARCAAAPRTARARRRGRSVSRHADSSGRQGAHAGHGGAEVTVTRSTAGCSTGTSDRNRPATPVHPPGHVCRRAGGDLGRRHGREWGGPDASARRTEEDRDAVRAAAPDDAGAGRHEGRAARLTRRLERAALGAPPPAVAATLQDVRYLTERTRSRLRRVGRCRRAGAAARPRAAELAGPRRRRASALDDDDPLVDEWTVVLPGRRPVVFAATDLRAPTAATTTAASRYGVSPTRTSSRAAAACWASEVRPCAALARHPALDHERQERDRAGEHHAERAPHRPPDAPGQVDGGRRGRRCRGSRGSG